MAGPVRNPAQAFQQLEAIMLRQMLQSSGAFKAGSTPGAQLRTDMFVETLADAVAKAGGLGIARMLEHDLGGSSASAHPSPTPFHSPSSSSSSSSSFGHGATGPSGAGLEGRDDLDDINSEAPLPEDPNAPSIDDFQPVHFKVPPAASAGTVTAEVTSAFGPRIHPITHDLRFHTGVDLRAPQGAEIRAAAGGVVLDAGRRGGYGNTVEIDHGQGTTTLYAHASELLVHKGQRVEPGQTVARVGQSGDATGPHLHFEVRRNDHPVNPSGPKALVPLAKALNSYRQRAEIPLAGTPPGAREVETP